MVKTISVNDMVYAELISLTGDIMSTLKKQISIGMTINMSLSLFRIMLDKFELREGLREFASKVEIMGPEAFDKFWDNYCKSITK